MIMTFIFINIKKLYQWVNLNLKWNIILCFIIVMFMTIFSSEDSSFIS